MCEKDQRIEVTPEMVEAGADAIFDVEMRVSPSEKMDESERREAARLAFLAMLQCRFSEHL